MTLVKLIFVFAVMVVLLMRRVNLGAVMAGVSLLLGLLFHLRPAEFGQVALATVTGAGNLNLLVALAMIMVMEEILRREGILQRMVGALGGLAGNPRVATAALPALVGLIPSAGGAIFSAPMVAEMTAGSEATAERKSFINYWYRHIWECASPISPNVLLIILVFEKQVAETIPYLLPTIPLAILTGWWTAFGGLHLPPSAAEDSDTRRHLRDLTAGLAPIVIVLMLVLLFRIDTAVAVALTVVGLMAQYRYGPAKWPSLLRKALSPNVLLCVAAVLLFKETLIATRAVAALAPLLTVTSIPVVGLFAALPFLVGMLTGSPTAFIGTAAPLLVGLLGTAAISPALVGIAIVGGYGGVMLSPLHMCFVLTVSYFKADLAKAYRMVIVPELLLVALSVAYLAFL